MAAYKTNPGNTPSAFEREQIIGMMEKEMEYRVDMFNKLTHTCFSKCMEHKYKESELNMGENSCIDRCVSKYWQVTNLVGQLLETVDLQCEGGNFALYNIEVQRYR